MSIRKKLILAFVIVVFLPYIIGRLFFSYGVDLIFGEDSYFKEQLRSSFWETSFAINKIHREFNIVSNTTPDKYLDPDMFDDAKIPHEIVGIVVKKNDQIINKTKLLDNYSEENLNNMTFNWGESYDEVTKDEYPYDLYPVMVQDYKYTDGSTGSVQIYASKKYYDENFSKIFRLLSISIMIIVAIVLLTVSYVIVRDITRKLRRLEIAVNRMESGDFATSINYDKNDEFKNLYDSFESMRQKLHYYREAGVKLHLERTNIISSISHDIRTPITAIKGYVQGIKDGVANTDEKRNEYLKIIYEKTIDIEEMIKDLKEFNSLTSSNKNYNFQKININHFLTDFFDEITFDIEKISGKIEGNYLKEEVFVMVDPVKLRRVFMNVYENSKKYRSKDNLKISVDEYIENGYVIIDITDNGIGVSKKDSSRVFDRFFRADKSRNTDIPGSGLGLTICKEIIDNHEGGISLKSTKKEGTTVSISLRIWDGD